MAVLGELSEYFSPGLTLTVLGRAYTVPLPSAELGLWCRMVAQSAGEIHAASSAEDIEAALRRVAELPELPESEGKTFEQLVLGSVHAAMLADHVPDPYVQFSARTAYIWILADEETAKRWWQSGGNPEALRPGNRAERRAVTRGRSTAAAGTTKSRTSTSGTKSPRKRAATGSRGRRSSGTGG